MRRSERCWVCNRVQVGSDSPLTNFSWTHTTSFSIQEEITHIIRWVKWVRMQHWHPQTWLRATRDAVCVSLCWRVKWKEEAVVRANSASGARGQECLPKPTTHSRLGIWADAVAPRSIRERKMPSATPPSAVMLAGSSPNAAFYFYLYWWTKVDAGWIFFFFFQICPAWRFFLCVCLCVFSKF